MRQFECPKWDEKQPKKGKQCPKWDSLQGKPVINGKLTANFKEMTGQKTEKTKKTPSFFLNQGVNAKCIAL